MNNIFKQTDFKKALIFVFISIVLYKCVENYSFFFEKFAKLMSTLSPFFWGIGFAYILNPLMKKIEKKFSKINRLASLSIVYIIFFGIVSGFFVFIIPIIIDNLTDLYYKATFLPQIIEKYLYMLPHKDFLLKTLGLEQLIMDNTSNIAKLLLDISNTTINSLLFTAMSLTSGLLNFILGVFVSIYFLYDKEKLLSHIRKITFAFFKKNTANSIIDYFSKVNFYFNSFLIGKLIDSTIIGIICFVGLILLKIKYALLLSILVGIFNMIPYFGPFMGSIPAILITLMYSPIQAVWIALFILALQQFDGWYLGPKILGTTVGATPLFIIFSILIGGSFAGVLGMLLAVPLFKSLFTLFEVFIEKKSEENKI